MKVLIVDDQAAIRTALEVLFEVHEIETVSASGPDDVLDVIAREDIGVVVQDMNFRSNQTSGEEGAALFRAIRKLDPEMPVVLMTAWASLETVVTLVKEGAVDYVQKPWDDQKLLAAVKNLLRLRKLADENARMRARSRRERAGIAARHDLCGLVYTSEAMQSVVSLAVNVAPSDAPILITGPNGSGKEKLAEIIQANSRRRDKPFVRVNAGGLPDELLEAELFGAEAGAYTGATKQRVGRFEAADGGTLFLDEIGNLSMAGQMKLLRVLQSGEFERLGSSTTRKVNVRIVSATNADLARAIAAGTFREDLYFRLNVIELCVPPLAQRTDDIVPLAEAFLCNLAGDSSEPMKLSPKAREALLAHDWPGNVRELQNRIQRATLINKVGVIEAADLGLAGGAGRREPPRGEKLASEPAPLSSFPRISRKSAPRSKTRSIARRVWCREQPPSSGSVGKASTGAWSGSTWCSSGARVDDELGYSSTATKPPLVLKAVASLPVIVDWKASTSGNPAAVSAWPPTAQTPVGPRPLVRIWSSPLPPR